MIKYSFLGGFLGGMLLGGCVTNEVYETDNLFCENISEYAATIPSGESRSVSLYRGGKWLVDHYKTCDYGEDLASKKFCAWLIEHTSTEFMEANVNLAMSCLQGHKIVGYIGNTGIETWTGKTKFYSPHIDAEDVVVTLEYSVTYFEDETDEDYLKISIEAE